RLLADPRLRIGVLAPDVGAVRCLLERVFEEELETAGLFDLQPQRARCFEISAAPPMTDYPLIAHALDLLSLQLDAVPFELASRVLLAPYPRLAGAQAAQPAVNGAEPASNGARPEAGDEAEFEGRAQAEAELRHRSLAHLPLRSGSASHSLAGVAREAGATAFAGRLEGLAALLRKEPDVDLPGRWRVRFIHRLDAMKWPGALASEVEGIVFRRWQDVLAELATLELVAPSMTASQALAHLRSICAATTVQASSEGPPVQAMGLLDAAGLEFDVVYAIGMTSTAFPAAARPDPLLPVVWQRLAKQPRASAEGEREFAELVWRRVRASAPEVIASYALCDESGEQKSASALLPAATATRTDSAPPASAAWWAQPSGAAAHREPYSPAPASAALVRVGNAALIGNQSGCPFRAFATHRLGAAPLRSVEVQPGALLRGNLVHAALEEVYRHVRDRRGLERLSSNNQQALVERAVDVALASKGGDLELDVRGFARDWLIELLSAWLVFERQERRDDWAIQDIEKPREARLPRGDAEGIEFHVRLDRIDRLEDGALLLIDFKTSFTAKSATRWAGERPDEPQLPLYATLLAADGNRVGGLAFANLAARDACSLVGLASTALGSKLGPAKVRKSAAAPSFSGDFAADLVAMQQRVDDLAREYLRGESRVDPKSRTLCASCGMESLCRVFESRAADAEQDEQEEPGES
ncbi:MAG: PD-(D/E)XK nuclease family protein, partial [Deltaproteobacteria bacterium]|nr:PD-(D/E)XK nuclease family protein [Deltaproteobacteria bacterium]